MRRVITVASNYTNGDTKVLPNRYRYLDYIWFDLLIVERRFKRKLTVLLGWLFLLHGKSSSAGEIWIFVVKLLRVHGGCLGIRRR